MSLVSPTATRADWEGDLKIKVDGAEEMTGKIRVKKLKQRMDLNGEMQASTIIDAGAKKAWNLMHAQKMAMEMDLSKIPNPSPACEGNDIKACFTKSGFTKIGSEKIDGHPCDIYENKKVNDGQGHVKIWYPTDLKEVTFLKSVALDGGKVVSEAFVKNAKIAPQADSHFKVPAGYKSMGNMQDLMKGFKMPSGD